MTNDAPIPEGHVIRRLESRADRDACLALQRAIWGDDFVDLAPPSLLRVVNEVGGLSAGAFDAAGRLMGFVFGFFGYRHGRPAHWSDMLAVRAETRGLGLGRALKAYQRDAVRALGAEHVYWTFEPLSARNAHLNFNVLGARLDAMVEDFYGETGSVLHAGLGTDRFVMAWPTDAVIESGRGGSAREDAIRRAYGEAPVVAGAADDLPAAFRMAIPLDVFDLLRRDPAAGAVWRARTRAILARALDGGHEVAGFFRDRDQGWYVLREGRRARTR